MSVSSFRWLKAAANVWSGVQPRTESCAAAVCGYSSLLWNAALQAQELTEALRRDVAAATLDKTISNHAHVLRQLKADGLEAQRRSTLATVQHQRAMEKYLRCSKAAVAAAETAQASTSLIPATKTELALQCIRLAVEAREAEEAYAASVETLQHRSDVTRRRVLGILRCLEEMDLKRMQCLKDSLTKAGVFLAANLRNTQYDLQHVIQKVEAVDPQQDLLEFVESARPRIVAHAAPPTLEKWPALDATYGECLEPVLCSDNSSSSSSSSSTSLSSATNVARQLLQKSPLQRVVQSAANFAAYSIGAGDAAAVAGEAAAERNFRATGPVPTTPNPADPAVLQRLQGEYSDFVEALWAPVTRGPGGVARLPAAARALLQQKMPVLQDELTSSLHRDAFLTALVATKRKKNKETPDRQALLPSMLQLRLLGVCCDWLLTAADAQLDAWAGRKLLLLAVEIAAPGAAADDPQQQQQWDWHQALQQQQEDQGSSSIEPEEIAVNHPEEEQQQRSSSSSKASVKAIKAESTGEPSVPVRWSLHRCVYHHRYWNRVTFWEEALAITISEELQRQKLSEKWQAEGPEVLQQQDREFRERNPCCSSLPSFGSFMSLYGIAPEQVQSLLLTVSRHLNLDEQTSEMLLQGSINFAQTHGDKPSAGGSSGDSSSSSSNSSSSNSSSSRMGSS
ncbi:hypothetical protein Esti_003408 [Eimeria stiedai]